MKIGTKPLRDALAFVKAGLVPNSPIAVFAHIRLRASGGKLTVSTYNMSHEMECSLPVGSDEFDVCVPGAKLIQVVGVAGAEIDFKVGKRISVSSDANHFQLPMLPGGDMPHMLVEGETLASGEWRPVQEAIAFVQFAAAVKDIRMYLVGVNVRATSGKIDVAASDGSAAAMAPTDVPAEKFDIIVPRQVLQILSDEALTRFEVRPNVLTVYGENRVVRSQLIAARFPDMSRYWSAEGKTTIRTKREPLIAALEAVGVVQTNMVNSITVRSDGKCLRIEARSSDGEEATATVEASGAECEFTPNRAHLLEMVKRCQDDVELYWTKEPALDPVYARNGARVMLTMPTRI